MGSWNTSQAKEISQQNLHPIIVHSFIQLLCWVEGFDFFFFFSEIGLQLQVEQWSLRVYSKNIYSSSFTEAH